MQTWAEKLESKGRKLGRQEGRREGRREGRQQGQVEGRLEGQRQGRDEGRLEGARTVLARVLTRRFGPLAPAAQAALERLDLGALERLTEQAVDAASLRELGLGA